MAKKEENPIYVLDTSVLIYDHEAMGQFDDNDIALAITSLEEFDKFKKGNDTNNYAARQVIRHIDRLSSKKNTLQEWIPFKGKNKGSFKIILPSENTIDTNKIFGEVRPDHDILNAILNLKEAEPKRKVILVSKDINFRLKAKSLNVLAEDYETGKVKDIESIYKGKTLQENVDTSVINELYREGFCTPESAGLKDPRPNHYYILKNGSKSGLVRYDSETATLRRLEKQSVSNIKPLNAEQVFAMDALLDPKITLVTLQGVAGTGKTLMALATALAQKKEYRQIYLARPLVPLGNKEMGFLPGDIKSKINPYMEPLWDNLKFIKEKYTETSKEFKNITQMVEQEKLLITPLAYIRGRSLANIFFIVDEAQNLTPHEVKTIISRAGEGTKVVFTGDIFQIDTPYLDIESNGLSYLISKALGQDFYAHVFLEKGERSRLANFANDFL